jgi:hypothetical protein
MLMISLNSLTRCTCYSALMTKLVLVTDVPTMYCQLDMIGKLCNDQNITSVTENRVESFSTVAKNIETRLFQVCF